jgi:2-polyprenyl-6-methoxyphenol hydroxylase-like FAD-dependent oxidoreductase
MRRPDRHVARRHPRHRHRRRVGPLGTFRSTAATRVRPRSLASQLWIQTPLHRYGQPPTANRQLHRSDAFRRGYLGVNAVEGGITNICGLVHASRLSGHKGRWDAFIEVIRGEESQLDALYAAHEPAQDGYLSSEPVIFRARSAVEGGVFMIGDASGVIDPLTGNGMAMAIQSALLASPMLLRLIEQPSRRSEIEDEYRRAHRAFFAPRIAWSRGVALLLSRPRMLDTALATVRSRRFGEMFLRRTRANVDEVERLASDWF